MRHHKALIAILVAGTTTGSMALAQVNTDVSSPSILPPEPSIKRVVVASPRAALITAVIPGGPGITNQPPVQAIDPTTLLLDGSVSGDGTRPDRPLTIGDVSNFAKNGDSIRIRPDRTVFVQLSPEAEGVWYDDAFGWLGTKITVYARFWGLFISDQPTAAEEAIRPWRFVGRDGAAALALGPAIGRAHNPIGVPIRFGHPGAYEVMARVVTYAYPVTSVNDPINRPPTADELRMGAVVSHDDVRLKVFVMQGRPRPEIDPLPHRELDLIDIMPTETLPGILE
jgi:hypothetical protein